MGEDRTGGAEDADDTRNERKLQIRWAFETLPGADGRRATTDRAVRWMAANGGPEVTTSHLSNVRSGHRQPGHALLVGLSRYFQLPAAFWDDPEVERVVRQDVEDLDALAASWRTRIVRDLSHLDAETLRRFEAELDRLRRGSAE